MKVIRFLAHLSTSLKADPNALWATKTSSDKHEQDRQKREERRETFKVAEKFCNMTMKIPWLDSLPSYIDWNVRHKIIAVALQFTHKQFFYCLFADDILYFHMKLMVELHTTFCQGQIWKNVEKKNCVQDVSISVNFEVSYHVVEWMNECRSVKRNSINAKRLNYKLCELWSRFF